MNAPVIAPAFAHLIPVDVTNRVRAQREIIADLSGEHAAHAVRLAEIDARFDAWSARIDALCAEWKGGGQ